MILGVVAATLLVSCSSGDKDTSADETTTIPNFRTTTTTEPPDKAVAELCPKVDPYVQLLGTLRVATASGTLTVADFRKATDQAKQAAIDANASLDLLVKATTEHATPDPGSGSTTTTAPADAPSPKEAVQARLNALVRAQAEAAAEVAPAKDDTLVRAGSPALQAAALNLQLASQQIYSHAGCMGRDEPGAEAIQNVVTGIQADLKNAGLYDGPVNGLYTPQTLESVLALQHSGNLPETGFLDFGGHDLLRTRLAEAQAPRSIEVTVFQQVMARANYYQGPIDGVWSTEVDQALQALQADNRQETTGAVDPGVLLALPAALANAPAQPTTTTTVP